MGDAFFACIDRDEGQFVSKPARMSDRVIGAVRIDDDDLVGAARLGDERFEQFVDDARFVFAWNDDADFHYPLV